MRFLRWTFAPKIVEQRYNTKANTPGPPCNPDRRFPHIQPPRAVASCLSGPAWSLPAPGHRCGPTNTPYRTWIFLFYSVLAAWPCLCIADQDIPLYGICYSPTVLCSLTPPSRFQPERPRAISCLVFLVFNSIATTTTTTTNKTEQHRAAVLLLPLLLIVVTSFNCFTSIQESRLKYLFSGLKYPASTFTIWCLQ